MQIKTILIGCLLALPLACTKAPVAEDTGELPVMRWDHRPEAPVWTEQTLLAIQSNDAALTSLVPNDIATWCPAYPEADADQRRAFWSGIISALAKHESTWNPLAAGGGGRWIGLTQISPRTAAAYGCDATSVGALKDGAANLSCAVEIAAEQVARDGMVAGNGKQGMGRDWAPFRSAAKREDMAAWTRSQSYCQKI
ncbi:transglycosylase SLT domain-containing protein [Fertoebacter nigrum]|uniref:Transglycosylase SLT domain-containing protein n=1 Tax=Fertoeibacter niger TaxID=2656921 RepID=A0A8X8KQ71_9RHOB|nr:transglycosylase SLT domain-containing protein [Fertoeibacter niger]NUB43747.1 transglycosylase SLT domain-containing protein [Fertoeibacter niger]